MLLRKNIFLFQSHTKVSIFFVAFFLQKQKSCLNILSYTQLNYKCYAMKSRKDFLSTIQNAPKFCIKGVMNYFKMFTNKYDLQQFILFLLSVICSSGEISLLNLMSINYWIRLFFFVYLILNQMLNISHFYNRTIVR